MSASQTNHCANVRFASPKRKPRTPSPTNEREVERQPERQPERQQESVSIHERVSLGKVSGVTTGKGKCADDRDRIIIDGRLLVVKFEIPTPNKRNYAPATKRALDLNNEECAYVGITDGKRHVFMRNGELFGGEGAGCYELETINVDESCDSINEFKVSSWGSDAKNKRIVREKMAEGGVYLSSDWGKKGVSTRRLNALKRVKVGDIMHLPMYTQGYEYVGKVLKEMIPISHDTIKLRFTEISKATWGEGGPAENETLYVFEVEWVKVLLIEKSENDLKHLVKNGGRCECQQGTVIRMKPE